MSDTAEEADWTSQPFETPEKSPMASPVASSTQAPSPETIDIAQPAPSSTEVSVSGMDAPAAASPPNEKQSSPKSPSTPSSSSEKPSEKKNTGAKSNKGGSSSGVVGDRVKAIKEKVAQLDQKNLEAGGSGNSQDNLYKPAGHRLEPQVPLKSSKKLSNDSSSSSNQVVDEHVDVVEDPSWTQTPFASPVRSSRKPVVTPQEEEEQNNQNNQNNQNDNDDKHQQEQGVSKDEVKEVPPSSPSSNEEKEVGSNYKVSPPPQDANNDMTPLSSSDQVESTASQVEDKKEKEEVKGDTSIVN